ncbi:helix-turn-helix domain-containing protein [Lentzea sp. NPDC042327]|uniref:helix-turn-helix domain-containing protein n=1 Tax=Lentzea sp. NPDC042327 TaxID=3154801 RepID=UPI0033C5A04E
MSLVGWLSVAEAAQRLGVSAAQVRDLVAAGRLNAVKPGRDLLVDADAVHRRLHVEKPQRGQPWSPRIAWAVLAHASGAHVDWLSPSELVRVKRYAQRPLSDWPRLLARRADVRCARMLANVLRRAEELPGVAIGGVRAANHHGAALVSADEPHAELLTSVEAFDALARMRGSSWDSPKPNVTVRVLPGGLPRSVEEMVFGAPYVPKSVAAADLLDLGDERSRGAAQELLTHIR